MALHVFRRVCRFYALLVALIWVPFALRFVLHLAVFVTHGVIAALVAMIELALRNSIADLIYHIPTVLLVQQFGVCREDWIRTVYASTHRVALSSPHLAEHLCAKPRAPVDTLLTVSARECELSFVSRVFDFKHHGFGNCLIDTTIPSLIFHFANVHVFLSLVHWFG